MQCHTQPKGNPRCEGIATHLLIYHLPSTDITPSVEPRQTAPVCKPCGQEFVRRDTYPAELVRLHEYTPLPKFLIIEGHRLVDDAEHGARCYDCGRTDSEAAFRLSMLHGCRARPESVDHLRLSGDIVWQDSNTRAEESARLWFDEAAYTLGMPVGDWHTVFNHPSTCATFTVGDDSYRVVFGLAGHRITAEKLENRGKPAPELINPEEQDRYKQVVFRFHHLVNKYESTYFATYTPGRQDVILYAPEGAICAVLRFPDLEGTRERRLRVVTDAVCDTFGPISDITFRQRIYQ